MAGHQQFVDFVSARWSSLYRLAWLLAGGPDAAEAVLRRSLVRLHARWEEVGDLAAPEDGLRRLMVGEVLARRRLLRRSATNPGVEPAAGIAEAPSGRTRGELPPGRSLLWPLVCCLPARQRVVLVLLHHEDLSEDEVAEVLGCSVASVRSLHRDAVAALGRGLAAADARSALLR